MKIFNRVSLVFWIAMSVVAQTFGLVDSPRYISYLSEAALIWTALICVQSDRTPRDVVKEIVSETDLNADPTR